MIVLVCGGRTYSDRKRVFEVLDGFHNDLEGEAIHLLVHGDCESGADRIADEWAMDRKVEVAKHPADWTQGGSAGPRRNAEMLSQRKPNLVIAFPGGRGTADMVAKARKAGVGVFEVKEQKA